MSLKNLPASELRTARQNVVVSVYLLSQDRSFRLVKLRTNKTLSTISHLWADLESTSPNKYWFYVIKFTQIKWEQVKERALWKRSENRWATTISSLVSSQQVASGETVVCWVTFAKSQANVTTFSIRFSLQSLLCRNSARSKEILEIVHIISLCSFVSFHFIPFYFISLRLFTWFENETRNRLDNTRGKLNE